MKNLKNINIYEGGISSIPGKKDVVKVSSNESPFGPSISVKKAISESRLKTNKYPDGNCIELKEAISKSFKLKSSNLFVGNGSDEMRYLVLHVNYFYTKVMRLLFQSIAF